MNQASEGSIGYTRCEECGGAGKNSDEASCTNCWGTGLVPVFQEPAVPRPQAGWSKQRRFPRYYTDLPLKLRDQREQELAGRCVIIAEGGVTAILPEPIPTGSVVTLQLPLPAHPIALETWAIVRNQLGLRHGFEFVSLPDSERAAIRQFCNGLITQSSDQGGS